MIFQCRGPRGKRGIRGAHATLAPMQLARILQSQGFGSRRECAAMVARGEVQVASRVVNEPEAGFETEGLVFRVAGTDWLFREKATVMLHKPLHVECSRAPSHHPSVLSLLPGPLRNRGVQPVGRLDEDTSGLLLLTDDGALSHRLTSPRHHVPKVYEVTARHPFDEFQLRALREGVLLRDAPEPVRALACEPLGPNTLRLTIGEGRYHQVRRMVAAAGNRVEALHRRAIGPLVLPADLAPGQWRWLGEDELAMLAPAPAATRAATAGP